MSDAKGPYRAKWDGWSHIISGPGVEPHNRHTKDLDAYLEVLNAAHAAGVVEGSRRTHETIAEYLRTQFYPRMWRRWFNKRDAAYWLGKIENATKSPPGA